MSSASSKTVTKLVQSGVASFVVTTITVGGLAAIGSEVVVASAVALPVALAAAALCARTSARWY